MANNDSHQVVNHTWWFSYTGQNDTNSTYFLPFIPGVENLDYMSMSLNATHPSNNESEYNLHSLFGLTESKATFEILNNQQTSPLKNKRIFLNSESTFSGSGKFVSHTLAEGIFENHKNFTSDLAGMMNFNMFGIPLTGPNIDINKI